MKWDCDKSRRRRRARQKFIENWHPWFAWHPVRVGDADCRWLERVERRYIIGWYSNYWEYRAP